MSDRTTAWRNRLLVSLSDGVPRTTAALIEFLRLRSIMRHYR